MNLILTIILVNTILCGCSTAQSITTARYYTAKTDTGIGYIDYYDNGRAGTGRVRILNIHDSGPLEIWGEIDMDDIMTAHVALDNYIQRREPIKRFQVRHATLLAYTGTISGNVYRIFWRDDVGWIIEHYGVVSYD